MSNTSKLYRYQISSRDNSVIRNVLVMADTVAATLILSTRENLEAATLTGGNTFLLVIQGRGGPKAKTSHARSVTIVMTGPVEGLSVGSRVIVPVFREDRWISYEVGQTGTYQGAGCRCVLKTSGAPSVLGRLRD